MNARSVSLILLVALIPAQKEKRPGKCRGAGIELFQPRLLFRLWLCPCVVLLVVDVFGSRVLFLVHLLLFALRELAAVLLWSNQLWGAD
jgi:hypothetical protein